MCEGFREKWEVGEKREVGVKADKPFLRYNLRT